VKVWISREGGNDQAVDEERRVEDACRKMALFALTHCVSMEYMHTYSFSDVNGETRSREASKGEREKEVVDSWLVSPALFRREEEENPQRLQKKYHRDELSMYELPKKSKPNPFFQPSVFRRAPPFSKIQLTSTLTLPSLPSFLPFPSSFVSMVSTSDLVILAMGGLLAVLYLYKDKILGPKVPSTSTSTSAGAAANGGGGGGSKLNANGTKKYQGDPRDFVAKMKDGVSFFFSSDGLALCWCWRVKGGGEEEERRREGEERGPKSDVARLEEDRFLLEESLKGDRILDRELFPIMLRSREFFPLERTEELF